MGIAIMLGVVNMLGGLMFGYNTGVIAFIAGIIFASPEYAHSKWALSSSMNGLVTACILPGALLGSMIGGPIADKFGRRVGIITLAAISVIFAPLLVIVPNLWALIGIRTCLGVAVGMAGVICPMYVSENAPPARRGALGILFQLAITIGIFLAYCIYPILQHTRDNWRIMFGLGAFPGALLLLVGFVIPESFVWQAKRAGSGEASHLLRTNEPYRPLSEQISMFVRSRALFIGLILSIAQQLTGINAFMFYGPQIFKDVGFNNVILANLLLGGWNVLTTLIAIPLVDKLGRRPLLIVGTSIMSFACIALGFVWQFMEKGDSARGTLAIALLLVFVFAFEIGDGPLFWMVAHELFTPEIKTVGASTLNAAQWIFNIVLTLLFPIAKSAIGQAPVFWIFGGIGIVCTLIFISSLPETRQTTKQIDV